MKTHNILLITASKSQNRKALEKKFDQSFILDFDQIQVPENYIYEDHKEDSKQNYLCVKIEEQFINVDGIVIDNRITEEKPGVIAVQIAHHIRLSEFQSGKSLNQLPIILTDFKSIDITEEDYSGFYDYQLFSSGGAYFRNIQELFEVDHIGDLIISKLIKRFNDNFYFDTYLSKIDLRYTNSTSRHQITNEWGAVKLAINAGYNPENIDYSFPPTIYFKYLLKKYGSNSASSSNHAAFIDNIEFSKYLKKGKVLLIDDNYNKGWKAVIEKFFQRGTVESHSFLRSFADQTKKGHWKLSKDIEPFDLVFLDLYLPSHQGETPDVNNGKKALNLIKETYQAIPVIVFTASNKSWNYEDVIENGADGVYIKEAPEFADKPKDSKENFNSFVKAVSKTLKKYNVLRPYWEKVREIESNFLKEINDNNPEQQFKARIEERLEMFYGLLKRGFEQREYNEKMFHFSDNELAFMTLWSILNEVSEAFYNKTQPKVTAKDGSEEITKHPSGDPIQYKSDHKNNKHHYKWKIKDQEEVFVEYEYWLKKDRDGNRVFNKSKSGKKYYQLESNQLSSFEFKNDSFNILSSKKQTNINFENTLFLQIGYLIEQKSNLSISPNKEKYQKNLIDLNYIRNRLYLTHGENISSGFYEKTEKSKRADKNYNIKPEGDIKKIFELVAFLLTGKEIEVNL